MKLTLHFFYFITFNQSWFLKFWLRLLNNFDMYWISYCKKHLVSKGDIVTQLGSLVEVEILGFQSWLSRFCRDSRATTATSCARTVTVNSSSSLLPIAWNSFFCQFTSSPRDAASDAIVSSAGTRSSSSSVTRATSSAKSKQQFFPATSSCLWRKSGANTYPWQTPDSVTYTAKIDANLVRLVKLFNDQHTNTSNIRVLFHTWSW